MATIDINSHGVGFAGDPFQHLYITYTLDSGATYIIRGGPESIGPILTPDGFINSLFTDNIVVVNQPYTDTGYDWDGDNNDPSQQLFSGTDAEVLALIDLALAEMNAINAADYDYNYPLYLIGLSFMPPLWLDLNTQNSNTAINAITDAMGLGAGVDSFVNSLGSSLFPGYDSIFENTLWDKNLNSLADALVESQMSMGEFFTRVSRSTWHHSCRYVLWKPGYNRRHT
jgi:hypothetical protein